MLINCKNENASNYIDFKQSTIRPRLNMIIW